MNLCQNTYGIWVGGGQASKSRHRHALLQPRNRPLRETRRQDRHGPAPQRPSSLDSTSSGVPVTGSHKAADQPNTPSQSISPPRRRTTWTTSNPTTSFRTASAVVFAQGARKRQRILTRSSGKPAHSHPAAWKLWRGPTDTHQSQAQRRKPCTTTMASFTLTIR